MKSNNNVIKSPFFDFTNTLQNGNVFQTWKQQPNSCLKKHECSREFVFHYSIERCIGRINITQIIRTCTDGFSQNITETRNMSELVIIAKNKC